MTRTFRLRPRPHRSSKVVGVERNGVRIFRAPSRLVRSRRNPTRIFLHQPWGYPGNPTRGPASGGSVPIASGRHPHDLARETLSTTRSGSFRSSHHFPRGEEAGPTRHFRQCVRAGRARLQTWATLPLPGPTTVPCGSWAQLARAHAGPGGESGRSSWAAGTLLLEILGIGKISRGTSHVGRSDRVCAVVARVRVRRGGESRNSR